jgi:TonB family protein
MPDWMRALGMVGMLCLPLAHGLSQDDSGASLVHYRLGESYLQEDNLQSAANEFREALNSDRQPAWTQVWSHIQLGRIFDVSGQHDRALNEYRQAVQTGDNTNGALYEANNYLQHAEHAVYLRVPPSPPALGGAPSGEPIQKTDPEYTDQARLAELEGTVVLTGLIDQEGFARNLEVASPLGLGLDEKAIEAVKQWHFLPVVDQSKLSVATRFAVEFRLSAKQSRWHLIQVQFENPPGTAPPVFVNVLYPIGAGIGPEAMEEGRLVVAMGRLATARLRFEVDEHGVPSHFKIPNASEAIWGSEAMALVGQWRFTPGMRNGLAVPVPCTVELVWGARELSASSLADVRASLELK